MKKLAERFGRQLIGLPEVDAIQGAEEEGFLTRVVARDGKHFIIDCSYDERRINLAIKSSKVAKVSVG